MSIKVIYGKAGTGKTTYLAKLINDAIKNNKSFFVLSYTHSAVNNIYNKSGLKSKNNFKTLHSYFRISVNNSNEILGPITRRKVDYLFIDEFSLIPKDMFKRCYNISKTYVGQYILSGDPLQLNPICNDKQYISFNKLNKLYPLSIKAIEHYHKSIFGTKLIQNSDKVILRDNKRSNNFVLNVLDNIYNNNNQDIHLIRFNEIKNLVLNNNYTFLASKYNILERINELVYRDKAEYIIDQHDIGNNYGFRYLYLHENMKIMVTRTFDIFYNTEVLTFVKMIDNIYLQCLREDGTMVIMEKIPDDYNNKFYPISPANILTIHKSQGKSIDNVILCVDDLFDIAMFYTGVTRAINDIVFYTRTNDIKTLFENAYVKEINELNNLIYEQK